ncbi:hypothetical protein CONPUDRAFT_157345 [Coniophora puteana RWD-64-598 SS2]|uniref:Uncharacterized protein n=1 Tax=Coniophora puteana (strain RWD-64-598) TaxID=741705 RepID=A0A5M3MDG8_CONPW|nr:uncharacterized protein CONPUDRAFT_157345 [Coniophora puteana RWD-64-598 SS2]EIW77077.1 hypothetical protein CONPUDRAFT_157345 [Coniophora puteana RWD-64-598 SS2]
MSAHSPVPPLKNLTNSSGSPGGVTVQVETLIYDEEAVSCDGQYHFRISYAFTKCFLIAFEPEFAIRQSPRFPLDDLRVRTFESEPWRGGEKKLSQWYKSVANVAAGKRPSTPPAGSAAAARDLAPDTRSEPEGSPYGPST